MWLSTTAAAVDVVSAAAGVVFAAAAVEAAAAAVGVRHPHHLDSCPLALPPSCFPSWAYRR